mgnify:CR=1 FL=1
MYEEALRAPTSIATINKADFAACADALEELAKSLSRTLFQSDRKAIEELFRYHGREEWARKSSEEHRLLVSLAQEVAQEARLAQLYANGKHNDPTALGIRKHRDRINHLARVGMATTIGDGDLFITVRASQQTWQRSHELRAQQAFILSSFVCAS